MSDCIFCKIASGEIPSKTLYEDEKFRVILDLGPATRGHALILAKKMGITLKEKLKCDGLNLVQNNGAVAGQTVNHFHLHMIPRYQGDGQKIGWTPKETDPEELEAIQKEITG